VVKQGHNKTNCFRNATSRQPVRWARPRAPYRRLSVWACPRLPEAAPSWGPALPPKPHAPRVALEPTPARVVCSYVSCWTDARRCHWQSLPRRLFPRSLLCVEVQADAPRTPINRRPFPPVPTSTQSPPCAPPAPLMAAAASYGLRPAAHQAELASTFPCTYPSSPTYPSPPPSRHLTGTAVAAADAAGRRRPHLAGPLPAQPSTGIDPQGPEGRSSPAPGRSRPAVRRNLAGPPPAGTQGPNCESPFLSRGPSTQQGYICNPLKNSRGLLESVFWNSVWPSAETCKMRRNSYKI
jgi:hypothetical protein